MEALGQIFCVVSADLIVFIPSQGITSVSWTNQAASNGKCNGITSTLQVSKFSVEN